LPPHTSAEELINVFSPFGRVEHATIIEGKNYGFVNFFAIKSAVKAKTAMEFTKLHGYTIRINYSKGVPCKQLWIGNVHPEVNDEELKKLFARFGTFHICFIPNKYRSY
jgi:RNA recognition motif-containing protein